MQCFTVLLRFREQKYQGPILTSLFGISKISDYEPAFQYSFKNRKVVYSNGDEHDCLGQVTAVKVALSSGSQGQKLDSVLAKPLKTQAFASPDKVAELVQKVFSKMMQVRSCFFFHVFHKNPFLQVGTAIQQDLPKVMTMMRLYLQNPSTRLILFKPIK